MKSKIHIPVKTALRTLILFCILLPVLFGCATTRKTPSPSHSRPASRQQQAKPENVKAQQQYYDRGLRHYSEENYDQAKDAFEKVVELGPKTNLGLKAQENLKKIEQIQKSLEEIKTK